MKKVIKLTESDLVKIVKRIIEEQITDKGPIAKKTPSIKVDSDLKDKFKNIKFDESETPETFLEKLNKSNIGITAFHLKQLYDFPVYPVYANIPFKNSNLRLSFEPFDKKNGVYMVRLSKKFK